MSLRLLPPPKPPLPAMFPLTDFLRDGSWPRLKGPCESVLVDLGPLEVGDEVIYATAGGVRAIAELAGWRNARPLLKRLDGVPLAVEPVVMVRIVCFVRESAPPEDYDPL